MGVGSRKLAPPQSMGWRQLLALSMCALASAFSPPASCLRKSGAPASRIALHSTRMLEGTQVAAAGFALFNAGYVGQLLMKPRQAADGDPYKLLQGKEAFRASDAALIPVTSCWSSDQKAVVVLMRSFG